MQPATALFCLVLCVPLAGCLGTGATAKPEVTPSATAAPPASNPMPAGRAATAPRAPAASSQPSSQAAAANASGNKEEWWQEGGVTREKINGMCWMKAEKATGRSGSADKKAELVDKCVAETLKQYPVN
jgi:hypothetical protein